jgi:hypothetical protein
MYDDAFAQQSVSAQGAGAIGLFMWVIMIALYVYFAFMQFKIASNKTGNADIAWFAFIPILNTILLIKMAAKPMWWFILLLVPFINVICFFILWIEVAKICGQSPVWGFLTMIPPISFVSVFILAYGSRPVVAEQPPPTPKYEEKPKEPAQPPQ